jgi:hypothetical protein
MKKYNWHRGPNGWEREIILIPETNKPTPRQQETLEKLPMCYNQWRRVDERVKRGLVAKKLVRLDRKQVVRADIPRYRSIDDP